MHENFTNIVDYSRICGVFMHANILALWQLFCEKKKKLCDYSLQGEL